MGPTLANSSIICNPLLVQKVSLGGKIYLAGVGIIFFARVFSTVEAMAFL